MRKRHRPYQMVALLALVCSQLWIGPPAEAVACPSGKQIFIRQQSTNTRWGVRGKVKVPNNNIDACAGAATFTTAHFTDCSTPVCGTQVEIGIRDNSTGPIVFTEKQVNGDVVRFDQITTAANNTFISLRLKVAQNGDVFFEYNFGSGWETTWSSPYSIGWAPGFPMGETEKIGDDTQMFSHHRDMRYITSSWDESAWGGMTCVLDSAPGWSWHPLSGSTNDWDVTNVGGDSCVAA